MSKALLLAHHVKATEERRESIPTVARGFTILNHRGFRIASQAWDSDLAWVLQDMG